MKPIFVKAGHATNFKLCDIENNVMELKNKKNAKNVKVSVSKYYSCHNKYI